MSKLTSEMIEKQFADDLARLTDRINTWHKIKLEYGDLIDAVGEAVGSLPKDHEVSMNGGYQLYIWAKGDGKLLSNIVRALRTRGWRTAVGHLRPQKGDTTWTATFSKDGTEETVYVNFSSTVCRRVLVGSEVREVPVYETVCEDLVIEDDAKEVASS